MAATDQAALRTTTRVLHLADADNLLGDPLTVDQSFIRGTLAAYRRAARFALGDHAVVASCADAQHAFEVRAAWPGVLHRWRRGPDGADLALFEEPKWRPDRGDTDVSCSAAVTTSSWSPWTSCARQTSRRWS
jgi:hypothetical protein